MTILIILAHRNDIQTLMAMLRNKIRDFRRQRLAQRRPEILQLIKHNKSIRFNNVLMDFLYLLLRKRKKNAIHQLTINIGVPHTPRVTPIALRSLRSLRLQEVKSAHVETTSL